MFNAGYLPAVSPYLEARTPQETTALDSTNRDILSLVNVDFDSVSTDPDINSSREVNTQLQEVGIVSSGLIRVFRHPGTVFKRNNNATK